MPLSDAKIRTLQPREKQYKVADFDGLLMIVKPYGSRLWHFKYRIEGREKLLSFGIYPAVSLAQARKARDAARADLAAGVDPGEARQEEKWLKRESQGHTFAKMADALMQKAVKEAATLQGGVSRPANRSCGPQVRQQFLLKYATRLDKQASVNRLMRAPFIIIVGMFAHQPACDLLRRPFAGQLGGYCAAQIVIAGQFTGFGPVSTVPSGIIRPRSTILV